MLLLARIITSLLKHLDELRILLADHNSMMCQRLMRQGLILQLVIANYLFLDMKYFVETVVSMADMAGVFIFMYNLL